MMEGTRSKQAWCKTVHKVDIGCEGNLLPIDLFRKLFQNANREQLKRPMDRHDILLAVVKQGSCN